MTTRLFTLLIAAGLALAPVAVAQKTKDTVRMPINQPISGMIFYFAPSHETILPMEVVLDGLVAYDETALKYEPLLARSWKRIDDTTVEFELRDDVKWHDGEAFDADDVKITFEWLADPAVKIRFKENWEWIERVEKISPHKIRLIAKRPTPHQFARLATQMEVMPEHIFAKLADKQQFANAPVGTGMYRAVEVNHSKGFFLEKNPAFKHGGSARPVPNIGKINLLYIPDAGTQIAHYLAGDIDLVRDVEYDSAVELAQKTGAVIRYSEGTSWTYLALDAKGRTGVKHLQDVRVRKAIMMAIDRQPLERLQYSDYQLQRKPEALCWKFQDGCDYSTSYPPYDPEGAKKLLADAGYKDGVDIEITALAFGSGVKLATNISAQLAKVGIRATIDPRNIGTYAKKQADGKIQMMVGGYNGGGMPDIAGAVTFLFDSGPRDYHGDVELQKAAALVSTTVDPAKRKEYAKLMFNGLSERAYIVPLTGSPKIFVHSKDLNVAAGSFHGYGLHLWNVNWK